MTQDVFRETMTIKSKQVPSVPQTSPFKENKKKQIRDRAKKLQESETTPLLCEGRSENDDTCDGAGATDWEDDQNFAEIVWWKTPSVYWMLPPFFIYAMAVGGVLVPKLNLILYLTCRNYLINKFPSDPNLKLPVISEKNPQCQIPEIQALSVKFTLYMTMVTGIISAFISPKLGAWSDQYGRLRILTIISLGALTADLIIILLAIFPNTLDYRWLLLSSLIDGVCGSFTAGFAITHAYATDCTPHFKRAVAFGYFHASLFLGIAIGPLLAALLVKHTRSLVSAFYAAVSLHFIFMVVVSFIIPESLTKASRSKNQANHVIEANKLPETLISKLNMLRQKFDFISPFRVFFNIDCSSSGDRHINLICLFFIDAIVTGITLSATTVTIYYLSYQYSLSTAEQGVFTSAINICRFCALVFIPRVCHIIFNTYWAYFQSHSFNPLKQQSNCGFDSLDLSIIRSGILFETLGYIGFAAARSSSNFVIAGLVGSIGSIASPTLKCAMTKHVPYDQVGQLLGSMGFLHSLMRVLCPFFLNLIYAVTVGKFPQAVFIVLACCLGTAFLLSLSVKKIVGSLNTNIVHSCDQQPLSHSEASVDDCLTK
ncbi:putative membrane protein [Erysiphe neolycopersici]|uniref:Putative membrane protein n=1 Tax=Erysiphe neolycopersici TaxID=212602 RepID=A0A420I4T0_9PEZI|nr:putative membrane protein [Erysiphe neolycopersici]